MIYPADELLYPANAFIYSEGEFICLACKVIYRMGELMLHAGHKFTGGINQFTAGEFMSDPWGIFMFLTMILFHTDERDTIHFVIVKLRLNN